MATDVNVTGPSDETIKTNVRVAVRVACLKTVTAQLSEAPNIGVHSKPLSDFSTEVKHNTRQQLNINTNISRDNGVAQTGHHCDGRIDYYLEDF